MELPRINRGGLWVLVTILVTLLLVGGISPESAEAAQRTRRQRMVSLTNQTRERHLRDDLRLNKRLSRYAKRHSRAMARRGMLFHSESSTLLRVLRPYHWSIGGENVGVGSSVDTLQQAFMRSRTHRENILRRSFRHVAIGIVKVDGSLWMTVIFYG